MSYMISQVWDQTAEETAMNMLHDAKVVTICKM